MSEKRRSDDSLNPDWETTHATCAVCDEMADGLRIRMDHLGICYETVCLKCAQAIGDAIQEHDNA